ncbi:hypothetical protein [Massilia sp. Leaf139]|uniref:DUF7010 family protein n=1 Tax=Massilia sp. Leaf139 TaxID=1736272 RepID=UPI0006F30F7E|nr:hypothetical protein [Massilia sp. Leaf139]KQQ89262.1 hypothetical protein ASF77_11505 [Massilia sp. Leaf139]
MDDARSASVFTSDDFQAEMRYAYRGGGPGALVSGSVWCVAGCVCLAGSLQQAIWALFIGGMLIHPLSVLLLKLLGRPGTQSRGNPYGALAIASTIWMILMLPLAYGVALWRIELFFPAMLLVIGGRYLVFSTIYGMRLYWAFGAALALFGWALSVAHGAPALGAFGGAAIEAVFGIALLVAEGRHSDMD